MTLLEVMVGLALSIVLLGSMAWFVSDLLDTRDRLATATARDGAATALLERLESDLAFAVTAGPGASGVRGDATGVSILTRGVLFSDATNQLGDLQRSDYRFDAPRRAFAAQRSPFVDGATPGASRSAPPGARPSSASHGLLDGHLERVRFRYHDGRDWRERFDSRTDGGLPTLVEIALWWAPRRGSEDAADGLAVEDEEDVPDEFAEDDSDDLFDDFADFADDSLGLDRGAAVREAFRAPDRLRVIRIPDARPVDPDFEPDLDSDLDPDRDMIDDSSAAAEVAP